LITYFAGVIEYKPVFRIWHQRQTYRVHLCMWSRYCY